MFQALVPMATSGNNTTKVLDVFSRSENDECCAET